MKVNYKGNEITVRGGAWLDIMNTCFYTEIDRIPNYIICKDKDEIVFALPTR